MAGYPVWVPGHFYLKVEMMDFGRYKKAVVAVAGVLALVASSLSDGTLTGQEIGEIIGAVMVALGVYGVSNDV